jgi:hypothetical protein
VAGAAGGLAGAAGKGGKTVAEAGNSCQSRHGQKYGWLGLLEEEL